MQTEQKKKEQKKENLSEERSDRTAKRNRDDLCNGAVKDGGL